MIYWPIFPVLIMIIIVYNMYPDSIQPCNMKNRDICWRYKILETLYIGQQCLSPLQSKHLGTSHSSPNHQSLPCHIFLNLTDGLKSLPFQRWFLFWEKSEETRCQIWAVEGAESLGWFDVSQKTLCEMWCNCGCIVMVKLPITSCPQLWPSESSD